MTGARFNKWFNIRISHEMFRAIEREAATRQQTIASYCRDVLLTDLKRAGVRLRPLRTKQINKASKQAEEAAAQAA